MNNKAITPVVSIALLLVLSVIAVVNFQTYMHTLQSNIQTNVESTSTSYIGTVHIQKLTGNELYFKSSFPQNITVQSILVNGTDCGVSGIAQNGMNNFTLGGGCSGFNEGITIEIVVVTEKGVYSKKEVT